MTLKRRILVVRGTGRWVDVSGTKCWEHLTEMRLETMYFVDGHWLLLNEDTVSRLLGEQTEADKVSAAEAACWFVTHDVAVPESLQNIAEQWRLPPACVIDSKNTTRRRTRRHRRARHAAKGGPPGAGNETVSG